MYTGLKSILRKIMKPPIVIGTDTNIISNLQYSDHVWVGGRKILFSSGTEGSKYVHCPTGI